MLSGGHYAVIDMAVRALGHPLTTRHARTLALGAFREDTGYLPLLHIVYDYASVTHFYRPGLPGGLIPFLTAGPRLRSDHFFERAVRCWDPDRPAPALIALGRVLHLLVDMACPTHAQRVIHLTDPYEWYVDSHAAELRALPVPEVADLPRASDHIEALARFTQAYPADRTNNGWGHLLWRLGAWKKADSRTCEAQARVLIPRAAGHAAAAIRLFLRRTGQVTERTA